MNTDRKRIQQKLVECWEKSGLLRAWDVDVQREAVREAGRLFQDVSTAGHSCSKPTSDVEPLMNEGLPFDADHEEPPAEQEQAEEMAHVTETAMSTLVAVQTTSPPLGAALEPAPSMAASSSSATAPRRAPRKRRRSAEAPAIPILRQCMNAAASVGLPIASTTGGMVDAMQAATAGTRAVQGQRATARPTKEQRQRLAMEASVLSQMIDQS